ncbi:MAG TPA: hypothetical protein VG982_02990 [Candidatus Paceibacterota bacterium]|nr:hypothetical protein [Candidatus Paceibacterota bacterium]
MNKAVVDLDWGDGITLPIVVGVEFSDDVSFFTLEKNSQAVRAVCVEHVIGHNTEHSVLDVELHQIRGVLDMTNSIHNLTLHRKQLLTVTSDGSLLDFVSRYVFPKEMFTTAQIGDVTIEHRGVNVYYQYHANHQVKLFGPKGEVCIQLHGWSGEGFQPFIYVRDEPTRWIVHIRLLPIRATKNQVVVKYNSRWYNKALPPFIQRIIPTFIKNKLLYQGERKRPWTFIEKLFYYLFPFSAYPLGEVARSTILSIDSSCSFIANESMTP